MKGKEVAVEGYWNYRDELAIEDGLIVKGERIVIPRYIQSRPRAGA